MGMISLYAVWIFFGIYGVTSQGDSLRSALNAVDRRQRYLVENYPIAYSHENPAVLNYLPDPNSVGENELAEYFSDDDNDVDRQISSSFRERLEEGREKELEELSQRVLANLDVDDSYDAPGYRSRDPWHKYRNNGFSRNDRIPSRNRKRQFYPEFGYDSIGLRKREKYIPSEYFNEYNYLLNMNDDYPSDYIDSLDYSRRSAPYREREDFYNRVGPNYRSNFRHIPVSKRSSEYPSISKDKKLKNQGAKTDPKVEKDLSSIFATSDIKKSQKYPKKVEEAQRKKLIQANPNSSDSKTEVKKNDTKKEVKEIGEKPIQVTKKSIDWSDYFGLDRRKKSNDDVNKEWLIERFHKAIAVSKKNSEYPIQSFHHIDGTKKTKKEMSDSIKLENMDQKLKSIEDEIVDDALKYTGANEGVTDLKDIQEVEDGIISRLAKAYSIEKMRRALGEYKILIDKEREQIESDKGEGNEDDTLSEKKRVSVPRKQAVDPNKDEQIEDNHIKCTQGSGDCEEENYKAPIEVIEQMNYELGGCPKIQRDCKEVAQLLGAYAKIFEEACNTHQMCLICGNNNWYPATRQCNILYLSKVFDMCDGKTECQKKLQKSVRYLMNITRNLRNNPLEECNLVCPEGTEGL